MQALMSLGRGHCVANPRPHTNPPPRQRIEADLHQRQHLDQFKEFQDFKAKVNEADGATAATSPAQASASATISIQGGTEAPDEALRKAHAAITGTLAADLLDRKSTRLNSSHW